MLTLRHEVGKLQGRFRTLENLKKRKFRRKLKRKQKRNRGNLREGREAPPRRSLHPLRFCLRFNLRRNLRQHSMVIEKSPQ